MQGLTDPVNLFPNGDVENEFVNLLTEDGDFRTWIRAKETGIPTYWRLTKGAGLSEDTRHAGNAGIRLSGGNEEVSATVFSDYWRVQDPSMPFGLPLIPNKEVIVSFYYKTSQSMREESLSAEIRLGTIVDLPSERRTIALPASPNWKRIECRITPSELLWGAEAAFTLSAGAESGEMTWIDSVDLTQELGEPLNLVRNSGFERVAPIGAWPSSWEAPIEDQWVSWVGDRYRAPQVEITSAASGRRSIRASVTYAEVSGISQEIWLHQDRPALVVVDLWCKLDNSIGNRPPGYYGCDNIPNLTVFVYHTDGTMQEVSPTLCLGESDHDWDYRRTGFLPQKPVEKIRVQATLIGTEPTTSLWIDEVGVFELAENDSEEIASRKTHKRTLTSSWGTLAAGSSERILAANDEERLYLSIPKLPECRETLVYFNALAEADFVNQRRYLYDVIRITGEESVEIGSVAEKQGYVALGQFRDGAAAGVALQIPDKNYRVSIPFRALGVEEPGKRPLGFNIQWVLRSGSKYWSGNAANIDRMGSLVVTPPSVSIRSIRFGDRYEHETDQSQDLVTHPPIYAGSNQATLRLENRGDAKRIDLAAGIRGQQPYRESVEIAANEAKAIVFPYSTGPSGPAQFDISIRSDRSLETTSYPLQIPPAIEIIADREHYFPEESAARIEIHNRLHPAQRDRRLTLSVRDLVTGKTTPRSDRRIHGVTATLEIPIGDLRVNELPVQDYEIVADLYADDEKLLHSQSIRVGRTTRTERRPLPPIQKLHVDGRGRLVINDNFRFFPIVPSITIKEEWRETLDYGANVFRAYYRPRSDATPKEPDTIERTKEVWKAGAYTLTIGPGPGQTEAFAEEAEELLSHPGFLSCYAKQFYYWKLPSEFIDYRRTVERIMGRQHNPRLTIWGHHDSSFLYDRELPPWPRKELPVGYCYTKIMGRPGTAWRNAPFLTQTEQMLDPHRFKLAEVNYYVSFHDDEIVPEHFTTYHSIRGDDWRGVRNESYLAVIYGANGLYHYICTQKNDMQRLRGWFQELNYMWPAFVADDAENEITVSPANRGIEARLKDWNGKLYLLTANATGIPQKAEIQIEGGGGMTVRKLFDLQTDMTIEGDTIGDEWKKYDAFVYELTLPGT